MGDCCAPGVYRRREPHLSPLYQVVEDYYEYFERCYDERYGQKYGFWRSIIREKLYYKFLDCGDLRQGFARIRCKSCGHSQITAFSCKTGCVCPSCAQRRALDFGDWVVEEITAGIPIVSCTFTIPKMLRIYFRFDHSLYSDLSRCAYETMKECFQAALDNDTPVPGMIIGIHTAGGVLNHHPHAHAILSTGCFNKDGIFYRIPFMPDEGTLEKLFMHKVLKMMRERNKINEDVIERLMSWTHSGFNVHLGEVIPPEDICSRERSARYLVRSCISLEKMTYLPQEGKVLYGDSHDTKVYDALDFLALLSCHITDRWERRVITYGYWSNKSRGMRKKKEQETSEGAVEVQILEPVLSSKAYRKRWAALIKKIWNTDPLVCPKCGEKMSIIAFIDEFAVVKKILESMDLWSVPERAPPKPLPRDLYEYDEYDYECAS